MSRGSLESFEAWIKNMPRAELGGLLKEYIAESNHSNWEGFNDRNLSGVRKFLDDLRRYHEACSDAPTQFGILFTTTNPVR